mmetsp:Transcript_40004/g.73820  ORF Transcript_40004/g.73820 Transcript_40004/m.73820 type:complete len:153 (+) Transcript_40004:278-736(+)
MRAATEKDESRVMSFFFFLFWPKYRKSVNRQSRAFINTGEPLYLSLMDLSTLSAKKDAFAEDQGSDNTKLHIRVQQRNGRKCITLIEGLADDLDNKRICKAMKKNFSCNGALNKDEEDNEIIQLSGDQRTNVKDFLVDQEIVRSGQIVLHGF